MDIIAARQAVQYARRWVIEEEKGPLLLEFVTYRYGGHSYVLFVGWHYSLLNRPLLLYSMSDPGTTYRTREEV
jgi:pyruvate dehydrogenase E1 component alpha subunit